MSALAGLEVIHVFLVEVLVCLLIEWRSRARERAAAKAPGRADESAAAKAAS
jgi:hypothetical protein